jgi:photosystem II stability/assembly factor-like uncharacterized protein
VRPLYIAGALIAALLAPLQAQQWKLQYFYDQNKSSFRITDLQFLSDKRGLAVGVIERGSHQSPSSVLTSDGGAHWQTIALKEWPVSLFFLNESLGFMVTTKGLWQTTEAGRNWAKLPKLPPEIVRVYFTDEKNGWAIGGKKTVFETHDGAQTWTKVETASQPPGNPQYSVYTFIGFATPKDGIITGYNLPPRFWGPDLPSWIDPQSSLDQRDTPHLNYSLVTHDAGKTWRASSESLFGSTSRIRFLPNGLGLGLVEYSDSFRYPSEAYKLEWKANKSATVYKNPKFGISDIWLTSDGASYLAGALAQGKLRNVIPGRVQVLTSKDFGFQGWTEMKVDYRATATRTILSGIPGGGLWMATDTGMILKLTN